MEGGCEMVCVCVKYLIAMGACWVQYRTYSISAYVSMYLLMSGVGIVCLIWY